MIIIQKPVRVVARSEVGEESGHLSDFGGKGVSAYQIVGAGGHLPHPGPTPCTNSQVMSWRRKCSEEIERAKAEATGYLLVVRVVSEWEKKDEKWVKTMSEKMLPGLASTVSTLHHTLLEASLFWIPSLSSSVSPIIFLSPPISIASSDGCSNLVFYIEFFRVQKSIYVKLQM